MNILEIFNTRELSMLLWVAILFVWLVIKADLPKHIVSILKTTIPLWWLFLSMSIYTAGSVWLLYKLGLWEVSTDLIKVVVYWFFGSAIIMTFNMDKIGKERNYIKKIIINSISLTVIISFIVNFYTFSLIKELLLVPLATLLIVFTAFSETKQEYSQVSKVLNWVITLFGFIVIITGLNKVITNYKDFTNLTTLYEFIAPILLTIMFIPYLYVLFLYSKHEQEVLRRKFSTKHE